MIKQAVCIAIPLKKSSDRGFSKGFPVFDLGVAFPKPRKWRRF
jgi:hypothetical protein